MALAAYSPEAQLGNGLRELNCADTNFAKIAGVCGKSRLIEGLSGLNDFSRHDALEMLRVLAEMKELQAASEVPVDWKNVDAIKEALAARRAGKKLVEEVAQEIVEDKK